MSSLKRMAAIAAKDRSVRVQAVAKAKVTQPAPVTKSAIPMSKEKELKDKAKGKQLVAAQKTTVPLPSPIDSTTLPAGLQQAKRKGDHAEEAGGSKRQRSDEVIELTDSPRRHAAQSNSKSKSFGPLARKIHVVVCQ